MIFMIDADLNGTPASGKIMMGPQIIMIDTDLNGREHDEIS
jgi:hypothetical protein